jgi:hypothetical protein
LFIGSSRHTSIDRYKRPESSGTVCKKDPASRYLTESTQNPYLEIVQIEAKETPFKRRVTTNQHLETVMKVFNLSLFYNINPNMSTMTLWKVINNCSVW